MNEKENTTMTEQFQNLIEKLIETEQNQYPNTHNE